MAGLRQQVASLRFAGDVRDAAARNLERDRTRRQCVVAKKRGCLEMGYLESNLIAGENIIYRAKLHWIVFSWPVIFMVLGLWALANSPDSVGVMFMLVIVTAIPAYVGYTTSEFGLTNRRILVKVGLVRRRTLELLLTKVEGIAVDQGVLGRILGYGTVVVGGTGGTKEVFHRIAAPFELRRAIQERVTAVQEAR